jgi:hypothetical protein
MGFWYPKTCALDSVWSRAFWSGFQQIDEPGYSRSLNRVLCGFFRAADGLSESLASRNETAIKQGRLKISCSVSRMPRCEGAKDFLRPGAVVALSLSGPSIFRVPSTRLGRFRFSSVGPFVVNGPSFEGSEWPVERGVCAPCELHHGKAPLEPCSNGA